MNFSEQQLPWQESDFDSGWGAQKPFGHGPEALLAWLSAVANLQGREEAYDLLLSKVKNHEVTEETLQSAMSRADKDDEAAVISVVGAILDRTSPQS
jgi:hypothetical protein